MEFDCIFFVASSSVWMVFEVFIDLPTFMTLRDFHLHGNGGKG